MSTRQLLFSGFGGQGILFAGKFIAYKGLTDEKQVSWLPSYGPEMRGGTASCSVIVSDEPVGSPIVSTPDVLIAMNLPSLDKYENAVAKGGIIIMDSSLIERKVLRDDVTVYAVPATQMASDNGMTEELQTDTEELLPTAHARIFVEHAPAISRANAQTRLAALAIAKTSATG